MWSFGTTGKKNNVQLLASQVLASRITKTDVALRIHAPSWCDSICLSAMVACVNICLCFAVIIYLLADHFTLLSPWCCGPKTNLPPSTSNQTTTERTWLSHQTQKFMWHLPPLRGKLVVFLHFCVEQDQNAFLSLYPVSGIQKMHIFNKKWIVSKRLVLLCQLRRLKENCWNWVNHMNIVLTPVFVTHDGHLKTAVSTSWMTVFMVNSSLLPPKTPTFSLFLIPLRVRLVFACQIFCFLSAGGTFPALQRTFEPANHQDTTAFQVLILET